MCLFPSRTVFAQVSGQLDCPANGSQSMVGGWGMYTFGRHTTFHYVMIAAVGATVYCVSRAFQTAISAKLRHAPLIYSFTGHAFVRR